MGGEVKMEQRHAQLPRRDAGNNLTKERRTYWILLTIVLIVAIMSTAATLFFCRPTQTEPPPQTEQIEKLQTEVDALRAEMEDLRSVQGYVVWERDWRNQK